MSFGVNSNGTLFTPTKARRLAELGPRAVTLGLDGVGDAAYLATRGLKNGFTKISRHIDNLKKEGIGNIGIGAVLMEQNLYEWVGLAQFALDKGLSRHSFYRPPRRLFHPGRRSTRFVYTDPAFPQFGGRADRETDRTEAQDGIVKNSEAYCGV